MSWSASSILAAVALLLAVIALFKPQWPLVPIAVILLAVGLLVPALR